MKKPTKKIIGRNPPAPKRRPNPPPAPPIPMNGWLKLWLAIMDKELDTFYVEDFKKTED